MAVNWLQLPREWLVHFGSVMPVALVRKMMFVCKRFRKHLKHSNVWKEQCKLIPAYQELVQDEIDSIQVDDFWHRWYLSRCVRVVPFRTAIKVKMKQSKKADDELDIWVPVVGTIMYNMTGKLLVVTEAKRSSKLNPNVNTSFLMAEIVEYSGLSKRVSFTRCGSYQVTMRDNGRYSIPMNIAMEFSY